MSSWLAAAILWLAPHLTVETAGFYAGVIGRAGMKHRVDPLLIASIIHIETAGTWDHHARSKTRDYGLMQVHVSATTNPHLLGREDELFAPKTAIAYGVASLSMWRAYHRRACGRAGHPFWAHYKWGYRVKHIEHATRVLLLLRRLQEKFKDATGAPNA